MELQLSTAENQFPIQPFARNLEALLMKRWYSIDYYQREYLWEEKHIKELINDLASQFLSSYETHHTLDDLDTYNTYFLGSIVISQKEGKSYIIDGQQRLTSLTLLIAYLRNRNKEKFSFLNEYIFSTRRGEKDFNIRTSDRREVMQSIVENVPYSVKENDSKTVENIFSRYGDIENLFPPQILTDGLETFIYWLVEKVQLIEIVASSDKEAYTIFETMNDRGLSLTPADMLQGYILANITNVEQRDEAAIVLKEKIAELETIIGPKTVADFFRDWFRGKFAENSNVGFRYPSWDRIGSEFHRWFREQSTTLGIETSEHFYSLVMNDFVFYADLYLMLHKAEQSLYTGIEELSYATMFLSPHYIRPIAIAAIKTTDSKDVIIQKLRVIAFLLDSLFTRKVWNGQKATDASFRPSAINFIHAFRDKSVEVIAYESYKELKNDNRKEFSNIPLSLGSGNKKDIHKILARMTEEIELASGKPSIYNSLIVNTGKKKFEIEHILAKPYHIHGDEFTNEEDLDRYRDFIGNLLLLEKTFNASFGNKIYRDKVNRYIQHNKLAGILNESFYDKNHSFVNNPSLSNYAVQHPYLTFRPYASFGKQAILDRNVFYMNLANVIWSPEKLFPIVGASSLQDLQAYVQDLQKENPEEKITWNDEPAKEDGLHYNGKEYHITMSELVKANIIIPGNIALHIKNKIRVDATLTKDGFISYRDVNYSSPTQAKKSVLANESIRSALSTSWDEWTVSGPYGGHKISLSKARMTYIDNGKLGTNPLF